MRSLLLLSPLLPPTPSPVAEQTSWDYHTHMMDTSFDETGSHRRDYVWDYVTDGIMSGIMSQTGLCLGRQMPKRPIHIP